MSKLSDNLKLLRRIYGLSVRQVAQTIERSASSISNWENERKLPDTDALEALCRLYQVFPDELLGWRSCKLIDEYKRMQSENLRIINELHERRKELDDQIRKYEKILDNNGATIAVVDKEKHTLQVKANSVKANSRILRAENKS